LHSIFLEPVSTLTHLAGAIAALVGMVWLALLTRDEPGKMLSLIVYGLSMVALFSASSLFHAVILEPAQRMVLNRLDHMAIFLLIAGTYTPIVYNLFPKSWRWAVLGGIWLVALCGMAYKLFSRRIHGFFNASIYPVLSWGGAVPAILAYRVKSVVPLDGVALLFLGGLIYSVGFLIYYRQRPDPWPEVFGHHEIWHLFVLGGSLCHFLFMLFYVVPA
jgi:hemolysin III